MKKAFAIVVLIAAGLRLAVLAGADEMAGEWLKDIASDGKLVAASINLAFGGSAAPESQPEGGYETLEASNTFKPPEADEEEIHPATEDSSGQRIADKFNNNSQGNQQKSESVEILPTTIEGGLAISNATSYDPDIFALMSEPLTQTLPAEGPQVLIIHTHGSESYTPDALNMYTPTDTNRTEDKNFNVIRVGDELMTALESYGIRVIHDREIYDYPSYTGSYGRSQAAVEAYLAQYPDIAVVIDLHRDALGTGGVVYKTMAEVPGSTSSQVMLLVGTGENGLSHPNWKENLKLALYLQAAAENRYPTLVRPIALKQERYNQHLTTGSLILEVGSSGNTLREAINAVKLFADAIAEPLLALSGQTD